MMELIDMPGMSPICRICRLGTFNIKQAGGVFRGRFSYPKLGVPIFWFGEYFCMGAGRDREKIITNEKLSARRIQICGYYFC